MKKLRMIVTSVVVLAIVGSAFAFNAKKIGKFCYSSVYDGDCQASTTNQKRVAVGTEGSLKKYYVVDWDGAECLTTSACTVSSGFIVD
jgi:hypothetical protein